MKKFLEFIWELIGPLVIYILIAVLCILGLLWIFTFFGLLMIFIPKEFPSPLWLKWLIGIFDSLVLIILVYEQVKEAYEKVYKN